jgi:hypothetical protein
VVDAADVSEVHAGSIFRVEVCMSVSSYILYSYILKTMWRCGGDRVGIGVQSEPVGTVDLELNIHNSTLTTEAIICLRNVSNIAHIHTA